MFKNVASQKLIVFAFDSSTNTPKTGDAANITAYVSKDYGAATVLTDTSASEIDATNAKGYYLFDLTQAETNADTLLFTAKSSTSNIVVIGAPATVMTDPPYHSSLSLDSSGRVDVIKINSVSASAVTTIKAVQGLAVDGVITTVTNQLTAAQIATGVWTDTTASDFTTALSIGKSVMNGVTLGTGLTVAAVTGLTVSNLDTTVSSRMATYTQPTGFLAATFPTTVASTTNITAGTITTATNVTTVNGLAAGVITAASIAADAITDAKVASDVTIASVTGTVGSVATAVSLSAGDSPVMQSGTATAGSASTITIQTALGADVLPVGCVIKITSGTGMNQARIITGYVDATKVVTVDRGWTTNPDATSVYSILYTSLPKLDSSLQVTSSVTSLAAGVITATSIADGAIDTATFASGTTIPRVTLCDTTTTNTDMRGTDSAALASVWTATRGGYIDNLSAGAVATAASLATTTSYIDTEVASILAAVDTEIAAIKTVTDAIGATGSGLSAIPWNAAWDVEVQSEVDDALVAQNLDHLVKIAVDTDFATTVHLNSVIGHLADNGTTATFDRTTDSQEAVRDRGDAAWITATGFATPTNITAATGIVLAGVTHTGAVIPTVTTVNGLASNVITAAATATDFGAEVADAILGRNVAGGSSTGRTVAQALAKLRNKWDIYDNVGVPTMRIYDTDDTTVLWEEALSTDVSTTDVITGANPA